MKVAFVRHQYSMLIPTNIGGGLENLLSLFMREFERDNYNENEIYFIQSSKHNKNEMNKIVKQYDKINFVFVKFNNLINFFQRAINKFLKIAFKHKKGCFLGLNYNQKAFKRIIEINPDIIIFEDYNDPYISQYEKYFGKDRLYVHCHQDPRNIIDEKLVMKIGGAISVSQFVNSFFVKYQNLNNYILKNCIDNEVFSKRITLTERDKLREKFGFKKDDFVVVFCGRVVKEKGVLELINAIKVLPKNIKLLIIGDACKKGNKDTTYVEKIKKIALQNFDKIKFTGYVENSHLYKYYQLSDLQVIPTLIEEGAGLIAIEGQMCGLPQIITRSGGMPEYVNKETIIIEKDENLVYNLTSEIINLFQDKEKLKKMSSLGVKNAKQYTLKNYYNDFNKMLVDIYVKTKVINIPKGDNECE